jgi:peptidyl-prolyl cis-trans isomerase A (cyclophilin A)
MRKLLILIIPSILISCTRSHNPVVIIATESGDIVAELFIDRAPVTAGNFLKYVDSGKYNNGNTFFYRVVTKDNQPDKKIKIEVIQGGFFEDSIIEKHQFPPIRHESTKETGILHTDGVISMARIEPGTATSEFFICVGDQPELDFGGKRNPDGQGFAAFGKIIKGMDIVRKIQQSDESQQYLRKPVKIISISRISLPE